MNRKPIDTQDVLQVASRLYAQGFGDADHCANQALLLLEAVDNAITERLSQSQSKSPTPMPQWATLPQQPLYYWLTVETAGIRRLVVATCEEMAAVYAVVPRDQFSAYYHQVDMDMAAGLPTLPKQEGRYTLTAAGYWMPVSWTPHHPQI